MHCFWVLAAEANVCIIPSGRAFFSNLSGRRESVDQGYEGKNNRPQLHFKVSIRGCTWYEYWSCVNSWRAADFIMSFWLTSNVCFHRLIGSCCLPDKLLCSAIARCAIFSCSAFFCICEPAHGFSGFMHNSFADMCMLLGAEYPNLMPRLSCTTCKIVVKRRVSRAWMRVCPRVLGRGQIPPWTCACSKLFRNRFQWKFDSTPFIWQCRVGSVACVLAHSTEVVQISHAPHSFKGTAMEGFATS